MSARSACRQGLRTVAITAPVAMAPTTVTGPDAPPAEVRTLAHPPVAGRRTTGRRAVKPVENGVPDHVRERIRSAHRDRAAPSCPKRAGPLNGPCGPGTGHVAC